MKPYLKAKVIQVYAPKDKNRKKRLVNGEDIKKIKMPAPCIFHKNGRSTPRLGLIVNGEFRDKGMIKDEKPYFELHEIDEQCHKNVGSLIHIDTSLSNLIEAFDVNIIKIDITGYQLVH